MNLLNQSISVAGAGDNTIITGVSGIQLRIWDLVIANGAASAQTVTVKDGANALTGAMALPSSLGGLINIINDGNPQWVLGSGNSFILNLANATNISGFVQYSLG